MNTLNTDFLKTAHEGRKYIKINYLRDIETYVTSDPSVFWSITFKQLLNKTTLITDVTQESIEV